MILTLSGIAIFILILAVINFVNLSVSGASARLKEIGVRKVIGSLKRQIALQFLTESVMMTLFAGICSLILYSVFRTFFEGLLNTSLISIFEFSARFWFWFVVLLIVTGLLPGFYPSLLLSSYRTVDSLKGKLRSCKTRRHAFARIGYAPIHHFDLRFHLRDCDQQLRYRCSSMAISATINHTCSRYRRCHATGRRKALIGCLP